MYVISLSIYGVTAYILDCNIVGSKFEFYSCDCLHFQTNTFGKCMNPFYHPSYG